jgi:ABC-2 type transport system ATP-binding protein
MDPATNSALEVLQVSHRYGQHQALNELSLSVTAGEIFALLGPNGSGKTTLFRLISTIARIQSGDISVFGVSAKTNMVAVRGSLGIVFQSPSLDPKLTVLENIQCQAALYGLGGKSLAVRIDEVVQQLGIADRLQTVAEKLSGGLKRRVELAKGILHRPRLLLLDEPSTGLDPAARLDLWHSLVQLRNEYGVTILLTTHLLEEADKAERIAILHQGRVVAIGAPHQLRSELGEQVLSIQTTDQPAVLAWLKSQQVDAQLLDHQLRVTGSQAASLVGPLALKFGECIQTLTVGQPSLEDVFVARTGHQYW